MGLRFAWQLVAAERDHRIDAGCTPGRYVAGYRRHGQHQYGDRNECWSVGGTDLVENGRHESRHCKGAHQSDDESDGGKFQALSDYERQQIAAGGSEREPNSELLSPG